MDTATIWQIRRRPGIGLLLFGFLLASIALIVSWWFIRALYHPEAHILGLAIGAIVGGLIPLHLGRGSTTSITATGELHFGFGQHPCLALPLTAIEEMRPIRAGLLQGIGIRCDPQQVRFLHRKGISYAHMHRWRRHLGVDLVLEFLTTADQDRIDSHRLPRLDRIAEAAGNAVGETE